MNALVSRRNRKLLLLAMVLLLTIVLLWFFYGRTEVEPLQGNDRFGLAFISAADNLADETRYAGALAAGARWDRWPLYWNWVAEGGYAGPHKGGQHDYDRLVIEDIERGVQPVAILLGTPADKARPSENPASLDPTQITVPLPRENPLTENTTILPPRGLDEPIFLDGTDEIGDGKPINPANAWAEYVFNTVERYRPGGTLAQRQRWDPGVGVRHWEIWNEPDFDLFWRGTVEEYYRLAEVAYTSIKSADPEAVVLLGGLAFYEKPNWLGQYLRLTEGDAARTYFDAVSVHHYWSIYGSEARLVEVRTLLDAYNLSHIPIWITESGLSVWDDFPATAHNVNPDTPWRGTMAEQAAYIIQHSALALYLGGERYFHFMLHDDCGDGPSTAYGLRQNFSPHACNPAQGQPRPGYAAYQLATEQFKDLVPLWRERLPDQDLLAFYRPHDRSRVVVLWATQGVTTTSTITATGESAQLFWINSYSPTKTEAHRQVAKHAPVDGRYIIALPPATNQNSFDPNDTKYHVGGRPYVIVEQDTLPPRSTITRLSPTSPPTFRVTWQGEDRGSGVASYDVWIGRDDEPLQPWLSDTRATQVELTGQVGHSYRFAVRARDRAGNEELQPVEAQASTRVISAPTFSGIVLGPDREPVTGATVVIEGEDMQRTVTTANDGTWQLRSLLPGEYTFQAQAPGYGIWPSPRSISLEATTDLLLTLAPPASAVASGDFEGHDVWSQWDWAGQVDLFFVAFDGQFAARLGHGLGEETSCPQRTLPGQRWSLAQQVSIPTEGKPVLSFVRRISAAAPAADEAWLEVAVVANGKSHALIPPGELWRPSGWTLTAVDLGPWRGQTVDVQFQVVRCSEQPFSVSLDRVSIGG